MFGALRLRPAAGPRNHQKLAGFLCFLFFFLGGGLLLATGRRSIIDRKAIEWGGQEVDLGKRIHVHRESDNFYQFLVGQVLFGPHAHQAASRTSGVAQANAAGHGGEVEGLKKWVQKGCLVSTGTCSEQNMLLSRTTERWLSSDDDHHGSSTTFTQKVFSRFRFWDDSVPCTALYTHNARGSV